MSGPPGVGMGLFDKLIGSRPGQPGIAPVPAGDLRAALLALGDGEPWEVRDGADHGCDLVAEWQTDVEQGGDRPAGGLKAAFRVRMKLDEAAQGVRHNSQQSGSSWSPGTSSSRSRSGNGFGGGQGGFGNGFG